MTGHSVAAGSTNAAVAALDRAFGDPWDPANPLSFANALAADERAELLEAGEDALDWYGLGAEFVPVHHGGRLTRLTRTIEIMRAVYRRDPCLGLGYGVSGLMAAANVWTAGSQRQRAEVAELLCGGGKLACAYHELAHGGDLTSNELRADPAAGGFHITGRKEVIANIARADAMVVFARTGGATGPRAHSQLLLRRNQLPVTAVRDLPRFGTLGMRGVPLGGIEFTDCPVGPDTVLGEPGDGLETALRSFQVTRVALPGMTIGIGDTMLRIAGRYARGRTLYGRAVADFPRTGAIVCDAFADLLVCDAFCQVAAAELARSPATAGRYAAAVKYLVPRVLIDAVTALTDLLGASFYLRDGEFGYAQKLLRDVRPAGFGHASAITCQLSLLPQLPRLARRGWSESPPAPDALFVLDGGAAGGKDLDFTELTVRSAGHDPLIGTLLAAPERLPADDPESTALRSAAVFFRDRFWELRRDCDGLPPHELGPAASPESLRLATRYAALLAASCCLGVWLANRTGPDGFASHPAWPLYGLARLARWFDPPGPVPTVGARHALRTELTRRYEGYLTFDLVRRHIGGATGQPFGRTS